MLPKKPVKETKVEKPTSKVPKWKLESAQFRAGLKANRGQQPTKEEKALTEQAQQAMVHCPHCGRKFNEKAGPRHITFCEKKAKQLPRMNTNMKKKR